MKVIMGIFLMAGLLFGQESGFNVGVSFVGMSMNYSEYDNSGNILDSEKTNSLSTLLVGTEIDVDYIVKHDNDNFSKIIASVMAVGGDTQYKGSILGTGNPYGSVISTTSNKIYDIDFGYEYSNVLQSNWIVSSGITLGYRYWERSLSKSQVEVYEWLSLRPNVSFIYKKAASSMGLVFEYQYAIDPKMSASNSSGEFKLGSADIVEISLPFSYVINTKVDLNMAYIYQYQIINKSNVVSGFYEPDSTAHNQYVKIGVNFKY